MTRFITALFVASVGITVSAQDTEFIRALERAQKGRPQTLAPAARIAPEGEPGTALVIHGRAFREDGRTPLGGAVIFAYHTDREGLYDKPGSPAHSWRLRGWAQTDASGQFEFRTIRPASYPSTRIAQHVHFTVMLPDARYHAGELHFEDDPFIGESERAASKRDGEFGSVRAVKRDGGVEHVDFRIRLNPSQKF